LRGENSGRVEVVVGSEGVESEGFGDGNWGGKGMSERLGNEGVGDECFEGGE
jgi:hypothetical protein